MNMIIRKFYFNSTLILASLILTGNAWAKGELLSRKYSWSFEVSQGATVRLSNYDCDVRIESAKSGNVEFELVIEAESGDPDDLDILNNFLQSQKFQSRADLVDLQTVFWESRNTNKLRGSDKTKIKLQNGEVVWLSEFKISANLFVPVSSRLELNSKYSKIYLPLVEQLHFESYDDNVVGSGIAGKTEISAKYTDFEFEELGASEFDLYDCNFEALAVGDLKLKSKYSDINIGRVAALELEGHDDKLTFQSAGNLKIDIKYSDIKSESAGNLTLKSYDSNFDIDKAGHIDISESKYSEYKFEEAGIIQINTSYDDHFSMDQVISVEAQNSKYSEYVHDQVDDFLTIAESHDDNIKIYKTSPAFKRLELEGKYTDILLNTSSGLPLKIDWKTKYGKIEMDDGDFVTRIKIKENSEYEYQGFRGEESETMPMVKVRGYDNKMKLNQL